MNKYIGLSILLLVSLFSINTYAQEYVLKMDSEVKNNNETGIVEITIKEGVYQLPEGQMTNLEGVPYTTSQKQRLQNIIDNEMQGFLGLVVETPIPALFHDTSTYVTRDRVYDLPKETLLPMNVNIKINPATWSSDNDTARFLVDARTGSHDFIERIFDTGHVNWSPTGFVYNGVIRNYSSVVPAGTEKLRLYAQCRRYQGSYCSAASNIFIVTFNADLPSLGDRVLINRDVIE